MNRNSKVALGVVIAAVSVLALLGALGLLGIYSPTGVGSVKATSMTSDTLKLSVIYSGWGSIKNHANWYQASTVYLTMDQANLCEPNRATCEYWGGVNPYKNSAEHRCYCYIGKIPAAMDIVTDALQITYQGYSIKPNGFELSEGAVTMYIPPIKDTGIPSSLYDQNALVSLSGYIELGESCSSTSDCGSSGWIGPAYCGS